MGSSKVDLKMRNHQERLRRINRKQSTDLSIEKTRQEIVKIITFYTYKLGGIGLSKLASLVGLDRRSLEPYLKKLIGSREIQRRGKKGKYYSVTVDTTDFNSSSFALGQMFVELYKTKKDTMQNNDYYQLSSKDKSLEKWLFELSNKIGAYLIFLFIESMNPDNPYTTGGKYDELISGESLCIEWIRNSFCIFISTLIREFRNNYIHSILSDPRCRSQIIELGLFALQCPKCTWYVEDYSKQKLWPRTLPDLEHSQHCDGGPAKWYEITSSGSKKPTSEPTTRELYETENLLLTKKIIYSLKQKFKSIYPILSDELEKCMKAIPNQVEKNEMIMKYQLEFEDLNDTGRVICKHHYSKVLRVGKYEYKECSKCGNIIPKNFKIGQML